MFWIIGISPVRERGPMGPDGRVARWHQPARSTARSIHEPEARWCDMTRRRILDEIWLKSATRRPEPTTRTGGGAKGGAKGVWVHELRGFEPLTFCMPCSMVASDDVVLGLVGIADCRSTEIHHGKSGSPTAR